MAQVDPRNMLNNFCFHVYAQKSLILPKIAMLFFDIIIFSVSTRWHHRAGSQLKNNYTFWRHAQMEEAHRKLSLYEKYQHNGNFIS